MTLGTLAWALAGTILMWVLDADAPPDLRGMVRAILVGIAAGLLRWGWPG